LKVDLEFQVSLLPEAEKANTGKIVGNCQGGINPIENEK